MTLIVDSSLVRPIAALHGAANLQDVILSIALTIHSYAVGLALLGGPGGLKLCGTGSRQHWPLNLHQRNNHAV